MGGITYKTGNTSERSDWRSGWTRGQRPLKSKSRETRKSFSLFLFVKIILNLIMKHSIKFEI